MTLALVTKHLFDFQEAWPLTLPTSHQGDDPSTKNLVDPPSIRGFSTERRGPW